MKERVRKLPVRLGLALCLFALYALVSCLRWTPSTNTPPSEGESVGTIISVQGPSDRTGHLPNECAIVATEAVHRLARSAAWARLLQIEYAYPDGGDRMCHMMAVWQVRRGSSIVIYDEAILKGALVLNTSARDAGAIAFALSMNQSVTIYSASLVK